jgi:hypothetical protein
MSIAELNILLRKYLEEFLNREKTGRIVVTLDCRNGSIGKASMTVTHEFYKKELTSVEE